MVPALTPARFGLGLPWDRCPPPPPLPTARRRGWGAPPTARRRGGCSGAGGLPPVWDHRVAQGPRFPQTWSPASPAGFGRSHAASDSETAVLFRGWSAAPSAPCNNPASRVPGTRISFGPFGLVAPRLGAARFCVDVLFVPSAPLSGRGPVAHASLPAPRSVPGEGMVPILPIPPPCPRPLNCPSPRWGKEKSASRTAVRFPPWGPTLTRVPGLPSAPACPRVSFVPAFRPLANASWGLPRAFRESRHFASSQCPACLPSPTGVCFLATAVMC